jgi:hypothetical protein
MRPPIFAILRDCGWRQLERRLTRSSTCFQPQQSQRKMGIQSMVKHATKNIMMNNSSNTRTGRLLTERATNIAQEIERSGTPSRRVDSTNHFWLDSHDLANAERHSSRKSLPMWPSSLKRMISSHRLILCSLLNDKRQFCKPILDWISSR